MHTWERQSGDSKSVFAGWNKCENHLEGSFEHRLLGPSPKFLIQ